MVKVEQREKPKKNYKKPELVEYGSVAELTLGEMGTKNGDGSGVMTML